MQKELIYDEQDKIQNIQLQEISKLKSLLHFREEVSEIVIGLKLFFKYFPIFAN